MTIYLNIENKTLIIHFITLNDNDIIVVAAEDYAM